MKADFVTAMTDVLGKLAVVLQPVAAEEEGGVGMVFFQSLQ